MTKHTPEPWAYGFPTINGEQLRQSDCQISKDGFLIADVSHGPISPAEPFGSAAREANARRIVACVNACAGLPLEQLEGSPVGGILNGVAGLITQRDELLAALEDVTARLAWMNSDYCGHIMAATDRAKTIIAKTKAAQAGEGV